MDAFPDDLMVAEEESKDLKLPEASSLKSKVVEVTNQTLETTFSEEKVLLPHCLISQNDWAKPILLLIPNIDFVSYWPWKVWRWTQREILDTWSCWWDQGFVFLFLKK